MSGTKRAAAPAKTGAKAPSKPKMSWQDVAIAGVRGTVEKLLRVAQDLETQNGAKAARIEALEEIVRAVANAWVTEDGTRMYWPTHETGTLVTASPTLLRDRAEVLMSRVP